MIFYSFFFFLFSPLVFLIFVWRYGLRRTLSGLSERFAWGLPDGPRDAIWVHAASVGEVRAAEPLLRALMGRGLDCLLTTTTVNAKKLAETWNVASRVLLAPVDRPGAVVRFLNRYHPRVLVLIETELWPHWLSVLAQRGVPVGIVNGRLSDGAFPLYFRLRGFWEPLLGSLVRVGVQNPTQAARFLQLGAHPDAVVITGNLKYDVPFPDDNRRPLLRQTYGLGTDDLVWVAGSTHPGEDDLLLSAFVTLRSRGVPLRLVLAPRHVERAPELVRRVMDRSLRARLRTQLSVAPDAGDVLILDTVGELNDVYGLADVATVGGSWVSRGGQNPLEPGRWSVPVLFGPHMENFRDVAAAFTQSGGGVVAIDRVGLESALYDLLTNADRRRTMGRAAREVCALQKGALEASLELVTALVGATPRPGAGGCRAC